MELGASLLSLILLFNMTLQSGRLVSSPPILLDVRPEYRSFGEVEPSIWNGCNSPIYLNRVAFGQARLLRFNEVTGKWEAGNWMSLPWLDGETPLVVHPGEIYKLEVGWQTSVDQRQRPKLFVLANQISKRSLTGRYKITVRYGLKPEAAGQPNLTRVIESTEFHIVR
ncbi:MAG: hypothetical protein WKF84_04185 [Pyrinomonadaceae bacterium]